MRKQNWISETGGQSSHVLYGLSFLLTLLIYSVLFADNYSTSWSLIKPSFHSDIQVEIHHPIYPIIVNNDQNPTTRILIKKGNHIRSRLEKIVVNLKGTTNVLDIAKAELYYVGSDAEFRDDTLWSQAEVKNGQIVFNANHLLAADSNYLWISLQLKSSTSLSNVFYLHCSEIMVNGKNLILPKGLTTSKRVGYALRKHEQDGVHTHRIPGIITTDKGTLVAVYDLRRNGSVDLQEDIDIAMSRSTDGGSTWEPMRVIMDMKQWGGKTEVENGIGDPSILFDRDNKKIWVAGIWAHGHPGQRNWHASGQGLDPTQSSQLLLCNSNDDGLTWSDPINITASVKDPKWHLLLQGPGTGITMTDGTLVFPAQYKDHEQIPHSTILYSHDHGESWHLGKGAKSRTTESQVVEMNDGSLMLNMRDDRGRGPEGLNGKGYRSIAVTADLGKTWTEHPTSRKSLIEPVCNAGLIKHKYGNQDLLIFVNPNNQYARRDMTIKISLDEGMTWPQKYDHLIDQGIGRGYPSLTSIDEKTIGILYEGSQADLVFQKLYIRDLID